MDSFLYLLTKSIPLLLLVGLLFFILGLLVGKCIWGCCKKRFNELKAELEAANAKHKVDAERIARLEQDLKSCKLNLSRAEGGSAKAPTATAPSAVFQDLVSSGKARVDEKLGVLYNAAPDQVDDLRDIKGVAEFNSAKLNEFGVYTFRQVANWTDEVIEEFSERLAFHDRVKREDWVGQCRELHRQKYGNEP